MDTHHFFAVDLGATSGRTILGTLSDGKMEMKEVTRFANPIIETGGHFYWDIYALYLEIIQGLKKIAQESIAIESIGIDTWGVDFVMVGKDGAFLRNPYCYRDPHTVGAPEEYFTHIPRERVYELTGIQFMNFNSLFQLSTLHRNHCSALEAADKILFVPDALSYMLTGEMVTEYTIASTSQILNPRTKEFEQELLDVVGVKKSQFARFVYPGERVGVLTPEVQRLTGLGAVPVIAVAGHDTASAVAAVPARNERFAYLSSGTWSLMGIEVKEAIINKDSFEKNFTNEGGIEGTTRFLKNICGMWLLEQCRREWAAAGNDYSYPELIAAAEAAPAFRSIINPDSPCFANPALDDRSHSHLLPPDRPGRASDLWRNNPMHLRKSAVALPSGVRLFARDGTLPHRVSPCYRWRVAQQPAQPEYLQCGRRSCVGRTLRMYGHR